MNKAARLFVAVLLLYFLFPTATSGEEKSSSTSKQTTVEVAAEVDNTVQLSLKTPADAVYPFKFVIDGTPPVWLELKEDGKLTGKPLKDTKDTDIKIKVTDYTGKTIAEYPVTLKIGAIKAVSLGEEAAGKATITTDPIYSGGSTISGKVAEGSTSKDPLAITVTHAGGDKDVYAGDLYSGTDKNLTGTFSIEMPKPAATNDTIVITQGTEHSGTITVNPAFPLYGEDFRAIVGGQQTGANSSSATFTYFLDVYGSWPLGKQEKSKENDVAAMERRASKWRAWGNLRVASFPQAGLGTSSVSSLVGGVEQNIGNLKVNQLASGAEFLTGLEYRVHGSRVPFRGLSDTSLQRFSLGLIAAVGATGTFQRPSSATQVFVTPSTSSPQYAPFEAVYPGVTSTYIGLTNTDFHQFTKEYMAGLRITTNYLQPNGEPLRSSPATFALTLGQNQQITQDHLRGLVGRIEAFYPLSFGARTNVFSGVYLFGTGQMRLTSHHEAPNDFVLQTAPTTVNAYDPNVTIRPLPMDDRDLYRLGFGVDLVHVIQQLQKKSQSSSTSATKTPTTKATAAK